MIAYCFRSVPGVCKIGSYIGNLSADGPFINTGFKPRFILYRNISIATDWNIRDTARDAYNTSSADLAPNSNAVEPIGGGDMDILSNGFKPRAAGGGMNGNGNTIIYLAIADLGGNGTTTPYIW